MDLRRVKAFLTAVESPSLREAAARMNLTLSPFLMQLRGLERELGVALFEHRPGRRIRLTHAGEVFRVEARKLLEHANDVLWRTATAGGAGERSISIGYSNELTFRFLPGILRTFAERFPDCRIRLSRDRHVRLIDQLRQGTLDLALVLPSPSLQHGLVRREIARHEFYVALPRNHAFASRATLGLADLRAAGPLITPFTRDQPEWELIVSLCAEAPEILGAQRFICDAGVGVLTMVEAGLGAALLVAVDASALNVDVAIVPLRPAQSIASAALWREGDRRRSLAALVDLLPKGDRSAT